MSNELRALRLTSGIPAPTIAKAIREIYPKFDTTLLSKCEHPDDYGVRLLPTGMHAARKLVPGWEKKERDRLRSRFCIHCRMDGETYVKLVGQIRQDGFKTVQSWMLDQVLAYINARSDDP